MKKHLFLTSAMAASLLALSACSSGDGWNEDVYAQSETAVCVNSAGERIPDSNCDDTYHGGHSGASWYYFGRNSRVPFYGDSVHDSRFAGTGSPEAQPGTTYYRAPASTSVTRAQAVSRGGFGSSGRSFGGAHS